MAPQNAKKQNKCIDCNTTLSNGKSLTSHLRKYKCKNVLNQNNMCKYCYKIYPNGVVGKRQLQKHICSLLKAIIANMITDDGFNLFTPEQAADLDRIKIKM